jgi:hypothetical protein
MFEIDEVCLKNTTDLLSDFANINIEKKQLLRILLTIQEKVFSIQNIFLKDSLHKEIIKVVFAALRKRSDCVF